jgi:Transposase DDE domain group 1
MKAEWLEKGANSRFVLTNLDLPPQELYDDFYVQRGADSEHRIKELKLGIKAGRLSCHRFEANQFRLLLAQAAYTLLLTIRQVEECSSSTLTRFFAQMCCSCQSFGQTSSCPIPCFLPLCPRNFSDFSSVKRS